MPNDIPEIPKNVQLAALLLCPSGREWLGLEPVEVDELAKIG